MAIVETKDSLGNNISNVDDLRKYLIKKGENHKSYKTYSNQKFVREIINNQRLYLSDGSSWNDVADRKAFNSDDDDYKNYGKCFSFSESESVAMWMLYGGIDNCGAMINFTKKDIKKLLKLDHIILGVFINGNFVEYSRLEKEKFEIKLIDILYTRQYDDCCYVRRSTEINRNVSQDILKELRDGCVKDIAWSYENECRLVVKVNKKYIKDNETVVKIDLSPYNFSESFSRVYHSPTYKGEKSYNNSELKGYVDWNLCGNCTSKKG